MPETIKRILTSQRFWEHVPGGILNAWFLERSACFGVVFFVGFIIYELWQCYRTQDMAHNDIIGHLGGLAIGGILILGGL